MVVWLWGGEGGQSLCRPRQTLVGPEEEGAGERASSEENLCREAIFMKYISSPVRLVECFLRRKVP